MDEAVIVSACRTPIGSFGGVFKDLTAADLGAVVIREAIARAGLDPKDVGDVIMGCVLQAGAGMKRRAAGRTQGGGSGRSPCGNDQSRLRVGHVGRGARG